MALSIQVDRVLISHYQSSLSKRDPDTTSTRYRPSHLRSVGARVLPMCRSIVTQSFAVSFTTQSLRTGAKPLPSCQLPIRRSRHHDFYFRLTVANWKRASTGSGPRRCEGQRAGGGGTTLQKNHDWQHHDRVERAS